MFGLGRKADAWEVRVAAAQQHMTSLASAVPATFGVWPRLSWISAIDMSMNEVHRNTLYTGQPSPLEWPS